MVRISDKEILEMLTKNARMPFTAMAERLGVSESAVRKRVKAMEMEGKIKGYTAIVDAKAMGYNVDALIGLDTKPEALFKVIGGLKRRKEVKQLWLSSGDHMIMLRAMFKDNEGLEAFVNSLEKMEGVTKVCPAILVEEIK